MTTADSGAPSPPVQPSFTRCSVDTNLLTRSVQPQAPEYETAIQAIARLRQQGVQLCITPQNLIEFWSVATRPVDVNGLGLTLVMRTHGLTHLLTFNVTDFTRYPGLVVLHPNQITGG